MGEEVGHVEGYGRYLVIRLGFLDEFQLEMLSTGTHLAAGAVVIDILRQENGSIVARSERLELLEYAAEFRGDLGEVDLRIHIPHRS